MSARRSHAVEFSQSIYPDSSGVTFKSRNSVALNYWVYVEVFKGIVWIGIFLVGSSCLIVGFWINRGELKMERFLDAFAMVSRSAMQRSCDADLRKPSSRFQGLLNCENPYHTSFTEFYS